ncbi:hypothetical protein [uncultured Klebsiella sp.]|uniref:hypothetical protein n=1 Tax=uncultured Klebsiella sp. TaxID=284011 RepID=UPI0028055AFF|nr:hypothetical protein [uncultured Klebsiella sp.]
MVNILTPLKHQASPCLLGYGSELSTRLRFYAVSFICVEFVFGRFWRKFDVADSHLGLSSDSFVLEVQMNLSLLPPLVLFVQIIERSNVPAVARQTRPTAFSN